MGNVSRESLCVSRRATTDCPGPQGAKAQQKRERNQAKQGAGAKSQIKVNEAAKNIICTVCKQTFVSGVQLSRQTMRLTSLSTRQLLTTRSPA